MSAPFVSFKAVKQAVSMAQILERYRLLDTLKRHGADGLTGPCPIHQGTNPTQFRVSLSKNCWNCFGGCEGGNVLDFVAAMERSDIRKAALLLVEWFQVESRKESGKEQSVRPEKPKRRDEPKARRVAAETQKGVREAEAAPGIAEPATPVEAAAEAGENPPLRFAGLKDLDAAHSYLVKKGFSREAMEELGVGYCRKGIMKERIAIPIHNPKGELVAYAGRVPDDRIPVGERYKYPETFHREWEVFNLHRAVRALKTNGFGLILTEDFLDVFRLYEAGYENAVALMGRRLSACQHTLLLGAIGRKSPLTLMMEEGSGLSDLLLCLARDFAVRLVPRRPEMLSVAEARGFLEEGT
jgi:DNA primase